MGFLDRRQFDAADPDGQALLEALLAVYDQARVVHELVLAAGLRAADFSWNAPMSQVWPEMLRKAATDGHLRHLVTTVAADPDTAAYEVIARLVAEPTEEGPAEDLRGLGDAQVRVLRSCAEVLEDLVATAEAAEHTSVLSPEFAGISARMQVELGRARGGLLAVKRVVGLTTSPDTEWAAKFIAARDRAQRDVEAAQDRSDMAGRTSHVRRSAAALLMLMTDRYPSLFTVRE